jgi:hypothetical protein
LVTLVPSRLLWIFAEMNPDPSSAAIVSLLSRVNELHWFKNFSYLY